MFWMYEEQVREYYKLSVSKGYTETFEDYCKQQQEELKLTIIKTEKPMNLQQEKKQERPSAAYESLQYVLNQQKEIKETIKLAVEPIKRIDGRFECSPSQEEKEDTMTVSEWSVKSLTMAISRNNEQILQMLQDVNMNLNRNL